MNKNKNKNEIFSKPNTDKNTSNAQKHKKNSNHAIIFSSAVVCLLFICMSIFMVRYSMTHEIEMFDNSYNSYAKRLSKEYLRGKIYSSDGEILAYSEGASTQEQSRVYPYANMFAHAIGYSTHGRMGVESIANYYLLNYHSGIVNAAHANAELEMLTADSVYTTLDTSLQQIAYDSLGVYKGAVIITEVDTGRILAMVSKPDFDPNQIDQTWNEMLNDPENTSLLNRVTQGLYPPGSTFKIITTLEYLRENNGSYDGYGFNCTGSFTYDGNTIRCYHGSVHGGLDFPTSFAKSCNSSFANIGIGLDKDKFSKTLKDLMFEEELPYDLPSSVSHTNISPELDSHNMMQASIGQGQDSISPLHLNMITCAIANGGELMRPHLVDKVVSESGSDVKTFTSQSEGRLITEEESAKLTELMIGVVQNGTAKRLKDLSYTAAGKTGSAEYSSATKDDSHAWFTGFAPAEDPQIAVTIIIEGAGSGGEYAVPIAKRMFDGYFAQNVNSEEPDQQENAATDQ
ncbi:MAG: penicillin-binding protein 2 [Lachnospiraceae bacterium]|nr:penicillin-binding protein 2 [Lachnospiraceae bacterium]